ncbi:hypothetical protein [Sorangium sp. So ce131]|uniref:hypothetical protein n=1 Tax=Sorangium sp. So ce131 TaxID=3133282 RepID=UPI003F616F0F
MQHSRGASYPGGRGHVYPALPELDELEQVQEGERFDLTVGGRRLLLGDAVRLRERSTSRRR